MMAWAILKSGVALTLDDPAEHSHAFACNCDGLFNRIPGLLTNACRGRHCFSRAIFFATQAAS